MLNNRKARMTTLLATGAATAAAGLVGASSPAQANGVWDRLAQCESGGNWSTNTGNGFYGGLQFTMSTWSAFGGSGMPHHASKGEQIRVAQNVLAGQGPGAWPVCSVRAGLTKGNGGSGSSQPEQPQQQPEQQQPEQKQPSRSQQRQAPKQQPEQQQAPKQQQPEQQQPQQAPKQQQPQQKQPSRSQQRQAPKQQQPQQAPKPSFGQAPNVKAGSETVSVAKGDTLGKLAKKHDVKNWQALWGANSSKVKNPNMIFVGQTLHLPA